MKILKYTKIQEEINGYFNIEDVWEFEHTEPVKNLLDNMRKMTSQLFDWMVAAKEGSMEPNLHGAILGLKKEISSQKEKIIQAIQQLRERQLEDQRNADEVQRRQQEINLGRKANQISENSLVWAKWALGVSIVAASIPLLLYFLDEMRIESGISSQLTSKYRAEIISDITKQVRAELDIEQKGEIQKLKESLNLLQWKLNNLEVQLTKTKIRSKKK